MIKYNLKELIAKREFQEKRRISLSEIAKEIDISRATLSKIANSKGDYSTKTEYVEKLCKYFECTTDELMTIIPNPVPPEK
ncbi:helix-turn-helix transcriptional regulator [bacterium]|nr:helix-turn-helix transcriptional regulator [bacterium]